MGKSCLKVIQLHIFNPKTPLWNCGMVMDNKTFTSENLFQSWNDPCHMEAGEANPALLYAAEMRPGRWRMAWIGTTSSVPWDGWPGRQPGSLGWCGLDQVAEGNTSSHRWGERQDHLPTGHEGAAGTRMISMVKKNHRKVEASQMEPKRSKKIQKGSSDRPWSSKDLPFRNYDRHFLSQTGAARMCWALWASGRLGAKARRTAEHFVRIVAGGCLIFTRTSIIFNICILHSKCRVIYITILFT